MKSFKLYPLKFEPHYKSVLWGGTRIGRFKGVDIGCNDTGESWEISAIPGFETKVANGFLKGKTLSQLIHEFGNDLVGDNVIKRYGDRFPLLIKLIDANKDLSIQVHPDDTLARERYGSLGKSEMWYIINSDKGAKILCGLKSSMNAEQYPEIVSQKKIVDYLAVHDSNPGDVFYIPAGRIHAIGSGNLLAEIQESSDITFRIYDYDRLDKDGKLRELHTEQAKEAIDYKVYDNYKTRYDQESSISQIANNQFFHCHLLKVSTGEQIELPCHAGSFIIIIGLEGSVVIEHDNDKTQIVQGETFLIPAALKDLKLTGVGKVLTSHIPA